MQELQEQVVEVLRRAGVAGGSRSKKGRERAAPSQRVGVGGGPEELFEIVPRAPFSQMRRCQI